MKIHCKKYFRSEYSRSLQIRKLRSASTRPNVFRQKMAVDVDTMLMWDKRTPLGTPVLPLVYMMIAVSSADGGVLSQGFSSPRLYENT